jgi:predicted MFS family arabinose efflux permease
MPQRIAILATIAFTAITTELLPSGLLHQTSTRLNVFEPVAGNLAAALRRAVVESWLRSTGLLPAG